MRLEGVTPNPHHSPAYLAQCAKKAGAEPAGNLPVHKPATERNYRSVNAAAKASGMDEGTIRKRCLDGAAIYDGSTFGFAEPEKK